MKRISEKTRAKIPAGMLSIDEPTFATDTATDLELIHAYRWYGMNYEVAEGVSWLVEYLKSNKVAIEYIDMVRRSEPPMVICSIARIMNRGINVPDRAKNRLIEYVKTVKPVSNVQSIVKKPVVQNKLPTHDDKLDAVKSNIELELDKINTGNPSNYSFYNMVKGENLSKNIVKDVLGWIMPRLNQIQDPEYKEYYEGSTKKQLKALLNFYLSIVSDCERIIKTAKTVKQPRKKIRMVSAEKVLKTFKYKRQDDQYKVQSIDPQTILKATTLVTFNTKYRYMVVYVAKENETLSVKGATIINYDEAKSFRKSLRKPQEAINKLLSGMNSSIIKSFNQIPSEARPASTGRINEDTILLRSA